MVCHKKEILYVIISVCPLLYKQITLYEASTFNSFSDNGRRGIEPMTFLYGMAHTTIQKPPPLKLKKLDCLKRRQFNQGNDLKRLISVLAYSKEF